MMELTKPLADDRVDTLMKRIDAVHEVGHAPGVGVWRRPYTPDERRVHEMVAEWMRSAGLAVRYDAFGNLFGRIEGSATGSAVLTGSHLDTVKNGGRFDGVLGVLGALAAVETLVERHGQPRRPLEVVAFVGEEGSRFPSGLIGSKAIVGELGSDDLHRTDDDGITVWSALNEAGFPPEELTQAIRADIAAFVELHIEQGRVLENLGVPVGIVSAIVGMHQVRVRLTGRADHAGTTPIPLRQDALVGAARMIAEATEVVREDGSVVTFGRIEVEPGATNIVPAVASFTIDFRHADALRRLNLFSWIESRCHEIARECQLEIDWQVFHDQVPVAMDDRLTASFRQAADELGIAAHSLVSGAGHDAMVMARHFPTAMLFVLSKDGRSHAPEEDSDRGDIAAAVSVLYAGLRKLAYT